MLKKALKISFYMFLVAGLICIVLPAYAKVSATEAERLKKDLTPLGAERAGNADGTIPAWDGGITGIPDYVTYEPEKEERPNPYPDDKVLFSITAQNMDQYKDKLSDGIQALFKRYPETFRIDVYPTRRPACAPQWVYDNTYKNALNGELIGDGADGFTGAHAGIPFPIPQNGIEVIYNHLYKWVSLGSIGYFNYFLVHEDGRRISTGTGINRYYMNYWAETQEEMEKRGGWAVGALIDFVDPARRKGEILLALNRIDTRIVENAAWTYMPGQRRVRRAPSIGYDTPSPSYGGYATYDDSYLFTGGPDRFNWKLVGKREMYIPYNCHADRFASLEEILTPYHMNPKYYRWELHRVWEIEATLKEGERHCYGRRVIWLDEDSWTPVLRDNYDTRGSLWRTGFATSQMGYNIPAYRQGPAYFFDFQVTTYIATLIGQGLPVTIEQSSPPEMFTPQYLRKMGKR